MEQTGLIDKILAQSERNWKSYQLANEAKEVKAHGAELKETLTLLKQVHASRDLTLAMNSEQLFLHQELAVYANSPEESNSIKAALGQFDEAKEALAVVTDHNVYRGTAKTYSGKRKEQGLPIDSFREFLKSHAARLSNRMASPLPVPEKNILRQRKENLNMVKEVYMSMQREALGIKAPSQDKGKGLEL